jgi:hypothetical protein
MYNKNFNGYHPFIINITCCNLKVVKIFKFGLKGLPLLFIDPVSKLAVSHGTPLACSRFYPLIIRTLEAWVELPHRRSRPAPPQGQHGLQTTSQLEDFRPATIYSIPELKEFRQLLSYPTFQQARLAEILLGIAATKPNVICLLTWELVSPRLLT